MVMPKAEQIKNRGQVYTPKYLVNIILDAGRYSGKKILKKHVIDNSCGNGAFLCEIVKRYCNIFLTQNNDTISLQTELEKYIHGIEIQTVEYQECISNLNEIAKQYNISNVKWDLKNKDTLKTNDYNSKMDYVFGNPPYVRVHNLNDNYSLVKQFQFAKKGMTDLFIVFFEIGFKMLKQNGIMCVITPNSWLSSNAGIELRKYIFKHKNLKTLIDFQHFQAFNATTYSLISCFGNNQEYDNIDYYVFNEKTLNIEFQEKVSIHDIRIGHNFYLANKKNLDTLRNIKETITTKYVQVKNGFATLNDNIFIGNFDFLEGTIPVLKASNGKWFHIIFPYDDKGNPIPINQFKTFAKAYNSLLQNKDRLSKNKDSKNNLWYLFGRTQAIKDVFKTKYAINTIIKDIGSIKLEEVKSGKGVYSGLYILTEESFDNIRTLIISQEFINYIKLLKKYKSGGYYTYSSKDLELYLNYKISLQHGQSRFFKNDNSLF